MKTVAVIGASSDRNKFGNKAVRAFLCRGYTVIPINPYQLEIEGLHVFRSVLEFPGKIEIATMYVPPRVGRSVLDEVASKKIPELWLNPGADDEVVVRRARELGFEPILCCSLLAIGESPDNY